MYMVFVYILLFVHGICIHIFVCTWYLYTYFCLYMVFVYILLFVHVWSKAHFECDILNACISIYLLEVKVVCGSCRRIVAEGLWMRG